MAGSLGMIAATGNNQLPEAAGRAARCRKWLWQNRQAVTAGALALLIGTVALLVPLLPLADPLQTDYEHPFQLPGAGHLLGTDAHGRDQLSRILWASRTSLLVGVVATALALAAGVSIGGVAGYGGRFVDTACMRTADVFLAFPIILGAMAIMVMFGPGRTNVFFAIAFFGWPVFARVFRSSVISVKEREYVKAARTLGASSTRTFLVHVLPNSVTPIISYAAMMVAGAILAEAGLSFIGLGVQQPYASWGKMLAEAMDYFEQYPWLMAAPGAAVTLTAMVFIVLGMSVTRAIAQRDTV